MKNVLIIEDDKLIRDNIRTLLSEEDYDLIEAGNGEDGLILLSDDIDIILLDVMMPGIDGYETCKRIRERSNVPVLFLTAKDQEPDKVRGLQVGGDDYLIKPFSYMELKARINALLRRRNVYDSSEEKNVSESEWIERRCLRVNTKRKEVYLDYEKIEFTDKEYRILLLLMRNEGSVIPVETIYKRIWEEEYDHTRSNTVMVHIKRLRKKIERDPDAHPLIHNVWGRGYMFEAD